jgi:hypothetical protein
MAGFLKRVFGGKKAEADARPTCENEPLQAVFEEFCATFCHKPGQNFMADARANADEEFLRWLRWDNDEPEPKAILRLMVDLTRSGRHVWECEKGFSLYHEGSWYRGGGPSEASCNALSVLAQVWGVPFTVYYTEFEGGPYMVKRFTPAPNTE